MPTASKKIKNSTSYPCAECQTPLPLRPKRGNELASDWQCVRCQATYHAVRLYNVDASCANNAVRVEKPASNPPAIDTTLLGAASTAAVPQGTATTALPPRIALPFNRQTAATRLIDTAALRGQQLTVAKEGRPLSDLLRNHNSQPYEAESAAEAMHALDQSVSVSSELTQQLERGGNIDVEAFPTLVRNALRQAKHDIDLFVRLSVNLSGPAKPGQHSLHVAMLAVAIGIRMGWDEQSLVDLGIGCLMHDTGMLAIPGQLPTSPLQLDSEQFQAVVAHPLETFEVLGNCTSHASLTSKMVAFQIHERCDGSGYPRRRRRDMIHEAARVAAVADVYVALVSPRPYRPAMMPYEAMRLLLFGARQGQFDAASVRGLLHALSLFPIGSYVGLSDGRVGRVLRMEPLDYTRPCLEVWRRGELDAPAEIVSLVQNERLSIVRALSGLPAR